MVEGFGRKEHISKLLEPILRKCSFILVIEDVFFCIIFAPQSQKVAMFCKGIDMFQFHFKVLKRSYRLVSLFKIDLKKLLLKYIFYLLNLSPTKFQKQSNKINQKLKTKN
jgi:hypothetical protein